LLVKPQLIAELVDELVSCPQRDGSQHDPPDPRGQNAPSEADPEQRHEQYPPDEPVIDVQVQRRRRAVAPSDTEKDEDEVARGET
jgi:hypothetical protein